MNFGILRSENFEKYRDTNYGFKEVTIVDAPKDFISFDGAESGTKKGYLIDMDKLKDKVYIGNGTISGDQVVFDQDDVLVYDKNGAVFYAKGFVSDGELFYNATVHKKIIYGGN